MANKICTVILTNPEHEEVVAYAPNFSNTVNPHSGILEVKGYEEDSTTGRKRVTHFSTYQRDAWACYTIDESEDN